MKHLNIKFLMMLICGTFVMNTALAATVNNKSSSFKVSSGTTTSTSSSDSAMAEKIRAQRAALDARDAQGIVATGLKAGATNNDCDGALRKCIEKKCNSNYSKCATDSDIIFSDKLNACKKDSGCTAHEFTLFTTQIKEDKKQEVALAAYNDVVDCGNKYNQCIIGECGPKFAKCLSKSNGDKALNKCKQIAARCTEADSGMVGRMGNIFGIVRQNEEIQIAADEKKLYELRDRMESSCKSLGAMFDERSFDCVFTAYFFAGPEAEPKASKKLYAGSVFDCTPDWFGIDITTFKENAYRATRAQTAASSAMLGSGVGTAVGTITSGAMGRALDRQKAEKELKEACDESQGMIFDKKKGECREMNKEEKAKAAEEAKKADAKKKQDEADAAQKTAKENCLKRNKDKKTYGDGKWVYDENNKTDPCSCEGNLDNNKCIKFTSDEKKNQKLKEGCESGKHEGTWTPPVAPETIGTCDCNDDAGTSYYQSKGAPFHCIASAKQMGANIRTGINKAVCKTKEGFVKLANGTVEAFTGEPGEKALPDCTDDKIHEREQARDNARQAKKDKKANQKNEKEAKQNACNAISGTMKKDTCVKDGIVYDLKKS